jgi:hypothetical protein
MDSRELEPNRFRPRPREDIDLNRRLRQLEEGLVGLNFTPDEAAERIRDAYTSLNARSRVVAETTGDAPQPPSDDEIITLALYGEAKAAAVWEFHAKRARGGE